MDSVPGFIFKLFFAVIATLFLLTIAAAVLQYSDKNNFEQYVNTTIERHGGLTDEALNTINTYSNDAYKGRFTVLTQTEKKTYGEEVQYNYEFKITPLFMEFEALTFTDEGTATSRIR